jgi:uncharacterized integral membrane protein (TIGR00698 family)
MQHVERNSRVLTQTRRGFVVSPGLRHALFLGLAGLCLTPWISAGAALALGMAMALTLGNPLVGATRISAKWLLQGCVVLLGFGMNLALVLRVGQGGLLFAAGSIVATFALGTLIGRRLRIPGKTAALLSAGTAICGGSAIAAVGSVVDADEGEMTVAMGAVFLLNAVALYAFPAVGHALGLSQEQFGMWAGMAIQDISSVVGASAHYGVSALQTATAVKLSRALWIVPVAFIAAAAFQAPRPRAVSGATIGFAADQTPERARGKAQVPWFIALFLLASVARSFVPGVAAAAPGAERVATAGFTLTLFLIGAGISRATLRAVGWKPFAHAAVLWVALGAGSLFVIVRFVAGS